MRDCVILINDRLVSLWHTSHSSSLNTQLLLSLVHPSVSESSVRLKKSVLFAWLTSTRTNPLSKISWTTWVQTLSQRYHGQVQTLSKISWTSTMRCSVGRIVIDTMSVRTSGSRLTSGSCPTVRTLFFHIGLNSQMRHSLIENCVPVLQERYGVLHEEDEVGIRFWSSGFEDTLSIHDHLLQFYWLRGCTTCMHLCKTWYSRTVYLYCEFASWSDMCPLLTVQ